MNGSINSLRILILEDQLFQRMVAEQVVSGLGVKKLRSAQRSEQALQLLNEDEAVDVVICDLNMPGMDGIQFIRHLAAQAPAPALIVQSAMDTALIRTVEDMAKAHGLQVLGYINKPMTRSRLRELLELYSTRTNASTPVSHYGLSFEKQELEQAINNDQFILYYQPKVTLESGSLVSVEALARWNHPKFGPVSPVQFIPIMESCGLICAMTMKMIDLALMQARCWTSQGKKISVGINLSPMVLDNTDLPDLLMEKTRALNLLPQQLILEITESSLIQNTALALETLARFKLLGFPLSIDDFGTGYSSMQQLNRIPFSELKIDRSFVSNASGDKTLTAIVEANISLAHKLNMKTVAEGVETIEDWQLLHALNCDVAQGYFIAKPMPAEELNKWEQTWRARQPILPSKPKI